MPVIKHTMMREDFSVVNARQYSAERNEVTIQMALDSIGPLYRGLLLTDEEDGVWTINNSITIPANVNLMVPCGASLAGPGNVTILGGLESLRTPTHVGPGLLIWDQAALGLNAGQINVGDLNAYNGWFENVWVNNRVSIGKGFQVGPDDPGPPGYAPPILTIADWAMYCTNYSEGGAAAVTFGGLQVTSMVKLTADTLTGSHTQAFTGYNFIDLNGHRWNGICRAVEAVVVAYSTAVSGGGSIQAMECVPVAVYPQDATQIDSCVGMNWYGPIPYNFTGRINELYGIFLNGVPTVGGVTGNVGKYVALQSNSTLHATDKVNHLFYNMLLYGNAPNLIEAPLYIGVIAGAVPVQQPAYLLMVNGIAQKPGGGSWTDSSSATMKRSIEPLTDTLDMMLRLRGTSYLWREEEHAKLFPHRQIGFIAEEVRDVLPEWITETPEGELLLTERGTFAMTVEAMRELDARLRALEGKEPRDVPRPYAARIGTPEE